MIPASKNQPALASVSEAASTEASRIAASLAALLAAVPLPQAMAGVGFVLSESICGTQEIAASQQPVDPKVLEWVRQRFDSQEAIANLREIQETGGRSLAEIDDELECLAQGSS